MSGAKCDLCGSDFGLDLCAEVSFGSQNSKSMLQFMSPFWPGFPHLKVWSGKVASGPRLCLQTVALPVWTDLVSQPSSLGTDVPVHPTEVRKAKDLSLLPSAKQSAPLAGLRLWGGHSLLGLKSSAAS